LSEISKRDNAGTGKLPERGIAGASELPKRLNDQKVWKRLHDVLVDDQVTSLGNSWSATETHERLEVKYVVSPEEDVGDDLYEEDTRVDEVHSRTVDLTDFVVNFE
jgi:hypothetical protein